MFNRKVLSKFFFNMAIMVAIFAIIMAFISTLNPNIDTKWALGLTLYSYNSAVISGVLKYWNKV